MNFAIYEEAMYEIVKKFHTASPSYHFVREDGVSYQQYSSECEKIMDEVLRYTDELTTNFPSIDENTYVMIVCGTIMETFVCEISYSIRMIDELQSPYANEKTKKYFKHIYYSIEKIRDLYVFDDEIEIIEWPNEFRFDYSAFKENIDEFNDELLAAIEECPVYPYAYCLLLVPYISCWQGISFDFDEADSKLKEAFVNSHKYMGDELFGFVMTGTFYLKHLMADVNVKDARINRGYFNLQHERIPAGIPFYRYFYTDEYFALLDEMCSYIPQECDGIFERKSGDNILTDQGDFRIEYKNYALYGGLCHMMPLCDWRPRSTAEWEEYHHAERFTLAIASLLDESAKENEQLKIANEELKRANEDLSRHIKLNQELVRNLSHSSANYLNFDKLAKTGIRLHRAVDNNPTIETLHLEGLNLMLQSEQELYLSRQLNSLVWRCSADMEALIKQIRSGLSTIEGVVITSPIEFALKVVMARVLFREDDRRAEFIRRKLDLSETGITKLKSTFMLDVLAKVDEDSHVLEWWNNNICNIRLSFSNVWEKLLIIKNKAFYDLIIEILTEQILNVLSHGDFQRGFDVSFGQAEEFMGRPRWTYIECKNKSGEGYNGGRGVGLSTLNETMLLLNSNKRGIETINIDDIFTCRIWILANLLRSL